MFTKEQMDTIFSNIEAIHTFSQGLLKSLEEAYVTEAVQKSQIGQVFLKHVNSSTVVFPIGNCHSDRLVSYLFFSLFNLSLVQLFLFSSSRLDYYRIQSFVM